MYVLTWFADTEPTVTPNDASRGVCRGHRERETDRIAAGVVRGPDSELWHWLLGAGSWGGVRVWQITSGGRRLPAGRSPPEGLVLPTVTVRSRELQRKPRCRGIGSIDNVALPGRA